MSSIVSTITPISSERFPISCTFCVERPTLDLIASIPRAVFFPVSTLCCAAVTAPPAPSAVILACSATCRMISESWAVSKAALDTALDCSCAPLATPSIARPICSVDAAVLLIDSVCWLMPCATCWIVAVIWPVTCADWPAAEASWVEAALRLAALSATCPTRLRKLSVISPKLLPTPCRRVIMTLKDRARSPISSCES